MNQPTQGGLSAERTMKTLHDYLYENFSRNVIDHALRANVDDMGRVSLYIHPHGHDGDTLDLWVLDDCFWPKDGMPPDEFLQVMKEVYADRGCPTCGGSRQLPLPKFADPCKCSKRIQSAPSYAITPTEEEIIAFLDESCERENGKFRTPPPRALYPDDIRELIERLEDRHPEVSKFADSIISLAIGLMDENVVEGNKP